MKTSKSTQLWIVAAGLLLSSIPLFAQATAGSVSGSVQDPQGAVIPGAKVTLVNDDQGPGSAREVATSATGTFVFSPVLAGNYTISVEVAGFKKYTQSALKVNVADRIGLPPIVMEVGATGESITVEASAVQLETVNAERSGVVTGRQMVDIAVQGRNFTGLLKTIPGSTADCAGTGFGCTFNGQRTDQNNYTVDGQNVTDIGVNAQFAYRVNMDAIAEVKVSTNGQTAEFGRNSGAQIQVVTRSGTKDFHATGWWFKRGEFMNANDFVNNFFGRQRQPYRYMTAGYNAGGPIFIPGHFNRDRDKLFGFFSHEWGRSFQPNSLRQITVPTDAERNGNFSASADAAGRIQTVYDPLTRSAANPQGIQFPGNIVPATRFSAYGPALLNWLPKPNVSGQANYNYQSQVANSDPSYDQVYRVDYNLSDKWRIYGRHLNSKQTQTRPYGRADTSNTLGLTPFLAPTYGWSLAFNVATIISPTLTNEFQFGYTVNGIPGDAPASGSPYYRSVSNITVPLLYPDADPTGLVPNLIMGGVPSATTVGGNLQYTNFAGSPYNNRNPIWNWTDNLTKSMGNHTIKAGLYIEAAVKTENAFKPYNATLDFSRDRNNPGDANWAFANTLLGNYTTYSQINRNLLPSYPYHNIEFYGQDTWKIGKKLTFNYGLRIAFIQPFYDKDNYMANFEYAKFDPSKAVRFFMPTTSGGARAALNPLTGEVLPAVYIGAIVPGFGDINNGMVISGQGDTPRGLIKDRGAHWGPRIGLAYQINDKTVLRIGGGVFYERIATFGVGITSNYTTNPPTMRLAQLYYGNVANIQSASSAPNPVAINRLSSDGHVPTVYNYNAGIQRQLPAGILLDVSYVGSQSRHLWLAQPLNIVGFGSAWQAGTQDPTLTPKFDGTTNLPVNIYRPYAGFALGTDYTFGGSSNYNALQIAINRRKGPVQFGVAYTWSKALGVVAGHPTDARGTSYGPLALDRTQSLTINYIYDIPSLARPGSFLANPVGRTIFDGWQLSGLTSMSSGAPVNVTYGISGVGGTTLNRQITGSEDWAPRPALTCNPNLSRGDRGQDTTFIDTSCFAPAVKGSIGNDSGYNRLRGPGINQWDMNVFKNVQVGGERGVRLQLRLEAYNAFNHTQWASFNSSLTFNSQGQVINLPSALGGTGGRFGFGALNAVRPNSQRILQIAVKAFF